MTNDPESRRLELQTRIDLTKTKEERNRLGQFATPDRLAMDILQYARSVLPPDHDVRFLDPAIGTGVFYSALLRSFSKTCVIGALGYEIDPLYADVAIELWKGKGLDVRIEDFARANFPQEAKANLLICNPPYVRHHHLDKERKRALKATAQAITGLNPGGLTGLYCYFMLIAHKWMSRNGLAGWLIPSEFMYVNYGRTIREYLTTQVTLLRVHRYDPNEVQFKDALVSSTVIWFKKAKPPQNHRVEFTDGGTLGQPASSTYYPLSRLIGAAKWSKSVLNSSPSGIVHNQPRLSDLFKIKRGLATGANNFFILTPEQIAQHRIPAQFLSPILPGPRYLTTDEIESDGNGNPLLDHKLFLLSCSLQEDVVKSEYPALWEYFQTGVEAGISQRYLCKTRSPWYSQETRPPTSILCTYMGRRGHNNRPFRFILNHSNATA